MSQVSPLKLGAIHPITGRQWDLEKNEAWPDLEIVLPFSRRVTDNTGEMILGPAVSPENLGGYQVIHSLNKIEIFDLGRNSIVQNVKGVWAAGPSGDTARIHLLALDPYSWLTPHGTTISTAYENLSKIIEQNFGYGKAETFTAERYFGEMLVKPATEAELVTPFQPALSTRVMKCEKFGLKFRTLNDTPIHINQLTLFILGGDIGGNRQSPFFTVVGGGRVTYSLVKQIYGGIFLISASIALSAPVDNIWIQSSNNVPLLVYSVRYREARSKFINKKCGKRTILAPGKYRITVEGESNATSSAGLPPSKTVKWHINQEFGVKYPETLRPYIKYSTIGDDRIFSTDPIPPPPSPLAWNPSLQGIGFPAYKKYLAVVHFFVPYMSSIYPQIRMQVMYVKGSLPSITSDLTPIPNHDDDRSLPQKSQDWINAAGGSVMLDEEIIFDKELPQEGLAKVALSFILPTGAEVKLDEWTCYISLFDSFSQHVEWSGNCLQIYYDSTGRNGHAIPILLPIINTPTNANGNRMISLPENSILKSTIKYKVVQDLLGTFPSNEGTRPYPEEMTSVLLDWRLPTSIVNNLKPFDQHTGVRFARFAQETRVRFNTGEGDKLDGINDTVHNTTIEAIVDSQKRPFALWLRTPEPIDWRRVTITLKIKHINQAGDCPTEYAFRRPLDMTVTILPSPDATSAFLIGSFAGTPTYLPRGEYELDISFDPYKAGLQKLKPDPSVINIPEQIKMKFIQPFGLDWPLPSTGVIVPARLLEKLLELYRRPKPGPDPEELFKMYEDFTITETLINTNSETIPITKSQETRLIQEMFEKERNLVQLNKHLVNSDVRPPVKNVRKDSDSTLETREPNISTKTENPRSDRKNKRSKDVKEAKTK